MGLMQLLVSGARAAPEGLTKNVGSASPSAIPQLGAYHSATGLMVSQATAMTVSTVYACIRIRAGSMARCKPRLVRTGKSGLDEAVTDHWLARLLTDPNQIHTWLEFVEMIMAGFLLKGNGYAVLLRNRDGSIRQMIPVNPDLVELLEAVDGSLFYSISPTGMWLAAMLQGQPLAVPEEDVFHLRDLSFNGLLGVSRVGLARDAIGLAMSQEQQAARWAGNGARPAGVLQSSKKLTPETAARLKAQWESLQAGVQNAGRTAVLEEGIEWKQMAMNAVDLEFLESRALQIREICRFFDVPPHMVGEVGAAGKSTLAELNADFVQRVVMNDVDRFEQRAQRVFGVGNECLRIELDHRELLRADLKTQLELARGGVMSGLLTQNEGRRTIGYGPVAGGDKLLAPVNLAPNGSAIDGTAPDGAGRPPAGEAPQP